MEVEVEEQVQAKRRPYGEGVRNVVERAKAEEGLDLMESAVLQRAVSVLAVLELYLRWPFGALGKQVSLVNWTWECR